MDVEEIDKVLRTAIREKRLLRLHYHGRQRIVEPHDYGIQRGLVRLLAYQIGGASGGPLPNWCWLDVMQMSDLELMADTFPGGRPTQSGEHHRWDQLFARVTSAT